MRNRLNQRLGTIALGIVLVTFATFQTDGLAAPPPGKGGGNGGGGSDNLQPGLVYVVNDAVITVSTAEGEVISKLTGGSKGWSIVRRSPTWSPDGSMIAYSEKPDKKNNSEIVDLYVMNSDGSSKTFIRRFTEYVDIERYTGFDWLPGGYLGFEGATGADVVDLADGTVQSLNLDLLHDSVGAPSFSQNVDPTTPGSFGLVAYIAYTPGTTNSADVHLAIVETGLDGAIVVDPSSIRRLDLPGNQNFPVISPNGLQVAFYDNASADGGDLAVVDLDYSTGVQFGTPRILYDIGFYETRLRPSWSPDSEWIAFSWYANGDPAEIARIRRDGTEFTNVTDSGQHENYPDWHPVLPPQN